MEILLMLCVQASEVMLEPAVTELRLHPFVINKKTKLQVMNFRLKPVEQ